MHADSNTDKKKYEEDLELKNVEDTNNDLRVIKQEKKSNFRIISVTDTINHEIDDESGTLDDGKIDTNNVPRDSNENLEGNEQDNLNLKTTKENIAKNNQDLENLPNVPVDRSERGGKINTSHKHYIYNLKVKKEKAAPRGEGGEAKSLRESLSLSNIFQSCC